MCRRSRRTGSRGCTADLVGVSVLHQADRAAGTKSPLLSLSRSMLVPFRNPTPAHDSDVPSVRRQLAVVVPTTSAIAAGSSSSRFGFEKDGRSKGRHCSIRHWKKRYMQQHNEVELSALGMAITTVVTIAEILKNNGLATEKKVLTSTVGMKDETKGRLIQKARIEIVLRKTEKFDRVMAAPTSAAPEAAAENKDEKETAAA